MKDRMKNTFDRICAEEELKDKTREFLTEKTKGYTKRRTFSYKYAVTAAVCLLFILAGGFWTYFMPTAAISIDINPSLELGVNRFGRVVSVHARNQDGKGLADSLNIKFMDYERAVEEILENQNVAELLSEDEVMTIAIIGSGGRQCRRMLSRLAACTSGRRNAYCYFASSDEVEKAHEAGLSYGKYRALLELQNDYAGDPGLDPALISGSEGSAGWGRRIWTPRTGKWKRAWNGEWKEIPYLPNGMREWHQALS